MIFLLNPNSALEESKRSYTELFGFKATFENEFYLLLGKGEQDAVLSFLLPNHPTKQELFRAPFQAQEMYLTIEVEEVDELYEFIKSKGVEIKIELRDEPWGDRHFVIQDPNGIGVDVVKYQAPSE